MQAIILLTIGDSKKKKNLEHDVLNITSSLLFETKKLF